METERDREPTLEDVLRERNDALKAQAECERLRQLEEDAYKGEAWKLVRRAEIAEAQVAKLRGQFDVARTKITDAIGTLHVLQSRADRILNGHDDPSEMAQDIRRLRQEAHGHLVAAGAALGIKE
jgi:hypothetical protein